MSNPMTCTFPTIFKNPEKPGYQVILEVSQNGGGIHRKRLIKHCRGGKVSIRKLVRMKPADLAKAVDWYEKQANDFKAKQEAANKEKKHGEEIIAEADEEFKAVATKMENAETAFAYFENDHVEDMSHLQQELDAADAKKKRGIQVVYEGSSKHSTALKEEKRARWRKLAAKDVSKTIKSTFVFGLASMEQSEIKKALKWEVFDDLNEVPDEKWLDLKDAFVDCGLDEHPFVVEKGIKLTKQKQSVETCKTMVARSLGVETSVSRPEEEMDRLAKEAAIDGDDDDDDYDDL